MMQPGMRNRRIQIQGYVTVTDDEGYQTQDWNTLYTVWANIRNFTNKEYFQAQAVQPKASCTMNIRYIKGLSSDMRVLYNDKTYNITSINDLNESHEEIELLCEVITK